MQRPPLCARQGQRTTFQGMQRCGEKGGQRLTPAPRFSSAQGFAALFAGRDVPPSECVLSEEERQHARQVNAARAAKTLATKSTGSVSTSKARALAYWAAVDSKVIPGEAIGTPAVLPPKAPTREPVFRVRLSHSRVGNPPKRTYCPNQGSASQGRDTSPHPCGLRTQRRY